MNANATTKISENIRQEFAGIRRDVQLHLAPGVTIDHARVLLAQHVPELVVGRAQLLLDSLLNYLMEDATAVLDDQPTEVKNDFYAKDLRVLIKGRFSLNPQALMFSFDRRLVHGGVAAGGVLVAGGVALVLFQPTVLSRLLIGLGTLVGSAAAFRTAYSSGTGSARRQLEADVTTYLEQSEAQVREWLSGVERAFADAFDKFASQYGIRRAGAS
jgi:hypothetical protein